MGALTGKNAVVTGAASGMGKAIALAYLKEGANVVAVDINEQRLQEFEAEVAAMGQGDQFAWTKCNVTKDEDCENVFKFCAEKFGVCNVLSQNAGIMDNFAMAADIDNDVWDRVIAINMTGVMKICRAAVRDFLANDVKGNIVVITSDAVQQQCTGGASYVASKCGAHGVVRAFAYGYANKGIRINEIGPGQTKTNIKESLPPSGMNMDGAKYYMSTGYNAHKSEWVYKSVFAPEDVTPIAVFLASDASASLCGELLLANGGLCLG